MKSVRDSIPAADADKVLSKVIDLYLFASTEDAYTPERAKKAGDILISDILSVTYKYAANNPVLVHNFIQGIFEALDNHKNRVDEE